jgi:O-antigen biosynthesis protein
MMAMPSESGLTGSGSLAFGGWLQRLPMSGPEQYRALAEAASAFLQQGRPSDALLAADRLCRIGPGPSADSLTLRAACLFALGHAGSALGQLHCALDDAPEHEASLRMLAAHGTGEERKEALLRIETIANRPSVPNETFVPAPGLSSDGPDRSKPAAVLIIVPVYGDAPATRRCIEALLDDGDADPAPCSDAKIGRRILLIEDASPDPAVSALCDELVTGPSITLIRNFANLGFAGSVNRALAERQDEDVLLVNADALPPMRVVERLSAAAYTRQDIGTVTPLSNNGEYTSIPRRFAENPMLDMSGVRELDRRLEAAFGVDSIEMPNGTGFCLFIKRAVIDEVGPFSTRFGRGYGEDIEFCLRASAAGFRNIAALGVYVGHEGGRSFGAAKRALVARNLALLEEEYPSYRRASAIFMRDDALGMRLAEAQPILMKGLRDVDVVLGPPGLAARCGETMLQSLQGDRPLWLIEARLLAGQLALTIRAADGSFPQNLTRICPMEEDDLRAQLEADGLAIIHKLTLVDPALIPIRALEVLSAMQPEYDIFSLRDPGLFCPILSSALNPGRRCPFCEGRCPCRVDQQQDQSGISLRTLVRRAARLLVGHQHLLPLAMQRFGRGEAAFEDNNPAMLSVKNGRHLAVFTETGDADECTLIAALAAKMHAACPDRRILVIGRLVDPEGLAGAGLVMPLGPSEAADVALVEAHGVGAAFFASRRFGAAQPLAARLEENGYRVAGFEWLPVAGEAGAANVPADRLGLSLALDDAAAASSLINWLLGRHEKSKEEGRAMVEIAPVSTSSLIASEPQRAALVAG